MTLRTRESKRTELKATLKLISSDVESSKEKYTIKSEKHLRERLDMLQEHIRIIIARMENDVI